MNPTSQFRKSPVDFDTWSRLAAINPDAFEKMRQAAIDEFIENAPRKRRQRLRRLQWRIDQERRASATPIAACIRISRMMWERIMGEPGLIRGLEDLSAALRGTPPAPLKVKSARVLDLRPSRLGCAKRR